MTRRRSNIRKRTYAPYYGYILRVVDTNNILRRNAEISFALFSRTLSNVPLNHHSGRERARCTRARGTRTVHPYTCTHVVHCVRTIIACTGGPGSVHNLRARVRKMWTVSSE